VHKKITFQFEMYCWLEIIFCDHTNKVEITQQQGRIQNCLQMVFNRGALCLCRGAWHCGNEKSSWFIVFTISIWGAYSFFGRAQAHQKLPTAARLAATSCYLLGHKMQLVVAPNNWTWFRKFQKGQLPVCLFAPPGCGPAYHQLNNIACKLLKLVPVQKLYHVYAR